MGTRSHPAVGEFPACQSWHPVHVLGATLAAALAACAPGGAGQDDSRRSRYHLDSDLNRMPDEGVRFFSVRRRMPADRPQDAAPIRTGHRVHCRA
jgi:hypothetical protein